jgi:hypothetical protein
MHHMATYHKALEDLIPPRPKLTHRIEVTPRVASSSSKKRRPERLDNVTSANLMDLRNMNDGSCLFICKICRHTNVTSSNLRIHMGIRHYKEQLIGLNGGKRNECSTCGKLFPRTQNLLSHLVNNHKALNLIQPDPKAKPKAASSSKDAQKARGNFQCPKCPVVSKSYSNMIIHISYHYKDKLSAFYGHPQWNCKVCSKQLLTEQSLMYHLMTTHRVLSKLVERTIPVRIAKDEENVGELPPLETLNCDSCTATFNSHSLLLQHVVNHHYSANAMTNLRDGKIECGICYEQHPDDQSFLAHLRAAHRPQGKSNESTSKGLLNGEESKADPQKPAKADSKVGGWHCGVCKEQHEDGKSLLIHMKTAHQSLNTLNAIRSSLINAKVRKSSYEV